MFWGGFVPYGFVGSQGAISCFFPGRRNAWHEKTSKPVYIGLLCCTGGRLFRTCLMKKIFGVYPGALHLHHQLCHRVAGFAAGAGRGAGLGAVRLFAFRR